MDVPAAARKTGLEWCRKCLFGRWTQLEDKDFNIKVLSGGLSNSLYVCSIAKDLPLEDGQPREVLLRIYGDIVLSSMEFFMHNSVIATLLAERKLSPKIYGLYGSGRLEEFLHAKTLVTNDLQNPEYSALIARKMAVFHGLEMPLSKQPDRFYGMIERWLHEIENNVSQKEISDERMKTMLDYKLQDELSNMRNIFSHVPSPVVFCHNDLQEGNILYRENAEDMDKMTFIDFEFGMYNNRGLDFGNHFNEWALDYSYDKPPYFTYKRENYPTKEQKKFYLREYLSAQGHSDSSESELEALLLESDTYAMGSHFLWGVWGFIMSFTSVTIEFDYTAYALVRFDGYFERKRDICTRLGLENNK